MVVVVVIIVVVVVVVVVVVCSSSNSSSSSSVSCVRGVVADRIIAFPVCRCFLEFNALCMVVVFRR